MPPMRPPLRPGDVLRIGRGFPRQRLDEDIVDFLRVYYETDSPGLGRVIECRDDGMIIDLWGHRFYTPVRATAPDLRPLSTLQYLLAPERVGERILRHEIEAGRVVMAARSQPKQWLVRTWLRRRCGGLPILDALGGRIRLPALRRLKAWLLHRLARRGLMPPGYGRLDHGVLIDRLGVTLDLTYRGQERRLWLDRILLHANGSFHLVGIDLDKSEQRTFRLDRVWSLTFPPLGEIDPSQLSQDLRKLCDSRPTWLGHWLRRFTRRPQRALPPAQSPLRRRYLTPAIAALRGMGRTLLWSIREARAAWHPFSRRPTRSRALTADTARWRLRLLQAIATLDAGGHDQITCLLPMNALTKDALAGRAYLRHLLTLTLKEARADPAGHPMAPRLLAEALAISPATRQTIPERERRKAKALLERLHEAQPGSKRIWVYATRRRGTDARMLLCECYLSAIYHVWPGTQPQGDLGPATGPETWNFYRTTAHFVARWDQHRFRLEAEAVPRLRQVIAWWDGGPKPDISR